MNMASSGAEASWPALRELLHSEQDRFPREAVAAATAAREVISLQLIAVLEAVACDPTAAVRDGGTELLFAMHLLASWRDTRAYRPLLAIGHLPPKLVMDELLGDMVHESYGRCLASVCDGDMVPLRTLIEDRHASVWVRAAALSGWKVRVLEGDAEGGAFEDYLRDLGLREAERLRHGAFEPEGMDMLAFVVSEATDVAARELLPLIRGWFQEGLVDKTFIDLRFVEDGMRESLVLRQQRLRRYHDSYITDVEQELGWLYRKPERREPKPSTVFDSPAAASLHPVHKVGRNDPCPCGSGKKFKKCHGA